MRPGREAGKVKVQELCRIAAERLRAGGIEEAGLEAELLLRSFLGLSRVEMHLADRELAPAELQAFSGMLERRLRREPLAYVTGEKEFWSLNFAVSPAVLIPRPETELLIETVLARIPEPATFAGDILDLGSGSGVIPVVLARELPQARLVGIDISTAALEVAAANAARLGVAERITWLVGDWCGGLSPDRRFAFIVANPPYVAERSRPSLQPELAFEPAGALFAGADGLAAIRKIVAQVPSFLADGGWLLMEIGYDQGQAVAALLSSRSELEEIAIVRDYAGLDRLAVARKRYEAAPAAGDRAG